MAQVIPFTSAAKQHREKIMSLSFTPTTTTTLLTSGNNTQVKAYPYLRYIDLHVYTSAAGSSGGTFAADAPWNILSSILLTDSNGTAIFGSQIFTGFDAYLAAYFGGYKGGTNDPAMSPIYSNTAATPEYWLRVPLEYNPRTGAGALPNMSSNATYGLQLIGNTSANIYTTAPTTTTPTIGVDVWMECWTLPEQQDLLGRNQMQGPPLLGTTQYTTKQSFTGLGAGANTVTLTRKGNMLRKWIFVSRSSTGARIAAVGAAGATSGAGSGGAFPNPFEFWWDGNRLTSDDPSFLIQKNFEEMPGLGGLYTTNKYSLSNITGALCYDWSAPYGRNNGGEGEGGWLATTQSSRLELVGSNWASAGTAISSLDAISIDVAPIALANQFALDSATGKLLFPAQPESRS